MKMNVRKMMKGLAIALVPMFFLSLQISQASAKGIRGAIKVGKKSGICTANINPKRKKQKTKVTCSIRGAGKYTFNVRHRTKLSPGRKGKFRLYASRVRRTKSSLSFKVRIKNKKNGKQKKTFVKMN